MASSFSTDLKIELMVTGENAGTWGDKTNTNLNLVQQAIAGFESISIAGGAQTTTLVMTNGALSNARNAVIKLTGAITGNQIVTIPTGIEKTYVVSNGTTGAFTVEFKQAGGTGVTFGTTDKSTKTLFADGTNIVDVGNVTETGVQTLTNKTLTSPKIGTSILDTNGNELALLTATASAVNEITLANAATGASPTISATGGDTNIGINLTPKGTGGIVLGAGAVGTPALTTSGDLNTGIFFPSADTIAFTEGGTEAMRITSDGRLGVGTTTPTVIVHAFGSSPQMRVENSNASTTTTMNVKNTVSNFFHGIDSDTGGSFGKASCAVLWLDTANAMVFATNNTERMRILAGGAVIVNGSTLLIDAAEKLVVNGGPATIQHNGTLFYLNRIVTDGDLIAFYQATVQEGSISVSGATVSYNGFTGSHWSRFIDESKPDVLRGTVMESLDKMTDWYHAEFETSYTTQDADGNDVVKTTTEKKPYALKANEQEGDVISYAWNTDKKDEDDNDIIEQVQATIVKQKDVKHVMSKISDTSEAKNVYGVFSAWDNDDLINNDFYVASCGSYVVRIKAGQTVSKGDLLQSNGDGTAKVQADDMIRASTFAKVLSNTVIDTYEDGSFIVPCSLMC